MVQKLGQILKLFFYHATQRDRFKRTRARVLTVKMGASSRDHPVNNSQKRESVLLQSLFQLDF